MKQRTRVELTPEAFDMMCRLFKCRDPLPDSSINDFVKWSTLNELERKFHHIFVREVLVSDTEIKRA